MLRVRLLKLIDRLIGRLLISLLPTRFTRKTKIPEKIERILIIRPGGIGDFILLVPAMRILAEKFPHVKIDVLCEKRNAGIAELVGIINKTYLYDRLSDFANCFKNRYDIVIDTEQWHRLPAFIAHFFKNAVTIGFATNERAKVFDYPIPYSHDDYEAYSFLHLIDPLTGEKPVFDRSKPFIDVRSDFLFEIIPELLSCKDRIIAIFPGASVRERVWGNEKFARVAKIFIDKGYKVLIIGSAAEKNRANTIKELAAECVDLTSRKIGLKDVASILKAGRLLLTTDTGLMHLAYAVGTPTVSLFGSGIEKKWAPQGKNHVIINKHLECSPCTRFGYTPRCKRSVKCLNMIGIDEVVSAMESITNSMGTQ